MLVKGNWNSAMIGMRQLIGQHLMLVETTQDQHHDPNNTDNLYLSDQKGKKKA